MRLAGPRKEVAASFPIKYTTESMVFCLHLVTNKHLNIIRKPNSIIVLLDRCKLARLYLIPCFSVNRRLSQSRSLGFLVSTCEQV